ncbi:MAG: hypothetical protein RR047_02880, partial [Bacilli bacterium]
MALDKIKNFFGVEENTPVVTGGDDEFYKAPKGSVMEDGTTGNKMMLLEPRAYSESQQIADYLKNR